MLDINKSRTHRHADIFRMGVHSMQFSIQSATSFEKVLNISANKKANSDTAAVIVIRENA